MPDTTTGPTVGRTLSFLPTEGEDVLIFDEVARAGAGPSLHIHARQSARLTVLEGRVGFWIGLRRSVAGPGTVVDLPPGVAHRFRTLDAGARVRTELRPALRTREMLEILFALDRAGSVNRWGAPDPLRTALLIEAFADEFPYLLAGSVRAQRAVARRVAPLARARGVTLADARTIA